MPASHSLQERQRALVKSLRDALKAFLDKPSEKNLHDLRTSTRRVDAAMKMLPKRFRHRRKTRNAWGRLEKIMKLSAKVRDLDTLRDRLSVYPRDGVLDLLLHRAQGKRRSKLKPLKVLAGSIHGMSSLTPEGDDPVGEKRARGRLEDNVEKLNSKLNRARQTALADAGDKEALHDLRKDCKRLRYTLELLPVKGKETRLKTLRLWQDLLGAIRGGDVTIGYLQAMGRLPEVDGILGKERIRRARDYEMFVRAWKENPRVWRAA